MPALEENMIRGRCWQGSLKDIYILGLTLEMSNSFIIEIGNLGKCFLETLSIIPKTIFVLILLHGFWW